MLRNVTKLMTVMALALLMAAPAALSQNNISRDYDDTYRPPQDDRDYGEYRYGDQARIDRYLSAEVWTNHHDGEYYAGDEIVIHFRVNRDAFVAIYNVDSRGRVNLLYPAYPNQQNFVEGGVTHRLPGPYDDYDLVVDGPEGVENIQIIASREPFPIPDWYPNSGLAAEGDDRHAFMDYVNERYFVRYGGQRFAYDRIAIYVNEWEQYYFRPVYYPTYHPWTVVGNAYIDYPFGASVYINGVYWGTTPLYLPRVYVGWHTITIYDRWGWCWEHDFHVSRYHTVVLDHDIIRPSPRVQSKYREVRTVGYRDPVKAGYTDYTAKKNVIASAKGVATKEFTRDAPGGKQIREKVTIAPKEHIRGSAKMVKTNRGWETSGVISDAGRSYDVRGRGPADDSRSGYGSRTGDKGRSTYTPGYSGSSRGSKRDVTYDRGRGSSSRDAQIDRSRSRSSSRSDYYQKKSGSDRSRSYRANPSQLREKRGSDKSGGSSRSYTPSSRSKSGGSSGSVKPSTRSGGSSSGKSSGGGSSKSSSGGSKSKGSGGKKPR